MVNNGPQSRIPHIILTDTALEVCIRLLTLRRFHDRTWYRVGARDHGTHVVAEARQNRHRNVNDQEERKQVRRHELDRAGRLPSTEPGK